MIFEQIQRLCEERNITIARVERECGFANATIRKWSQSTPSAESLAKVADYFEVSIDALLGRTAYGLSPNAIQYAKKFDELPDDKKQLAMAYMGVVQAQ